MGQVKRMKMTNERQEKSWMCIAFGIPNNRNSFRRILFTNQIYLQVCYHSHSHDIDT